MARLRQGETDAAWDLFLARYRRLIFAAIRHYAEDYDDVMDLFTRACEALRADDLRRLRTYIDQPEHSARFSTWLVTVVRHLTVDWFRERDGRTRLSAIAAGLPALQGRIFELVFVQHRSHVEAFELIRSSEAPSLSFRDFRSELRATYRTVTTGRRGHVLRELGTAPAMEDEQSSEPDLPVPREELEKALGCLNARERLAVELYVLEELPAEQVARIVGLRNAKAAYNQVYRALAAVRAHLEQAGISREDL